MSAGCISMLGCVCSAGLVLGRHPRAEPHRSSGVSAGALVRGAAARGACGVSADVIDGRHVQRIGGDRGDTAAPGSCPGQGSPRTNRRRSQPAGGVDWEAHAGRGGSMVPALWSSDATSATGARPLLTAELHRRGAAPPRHPRVRAGRGGQRHCEHGQTGPRSTGAAPPFAWPEAPSPLY